MIIPFIPFIVVFGLTGAVCLVISYKEIPKFDKLDTVAVPLFAFIGFCISAYVGAALWFVITLLLNV